MDLEKQKKNFENHIATFTDYGNIKILDFKEPNTSHYRVQSRNLLGNQLNGILKESLICAILVNRKMIKRRRTGMGIKTDCFAYKKNLNRCGALERLYCRDGECRFYRTSDDRCNSCKGAKGRTLSCTECTMKGLK